MGFFSDLIEAVTPWSEVQAEAPKEEEVKVCFCVFYLRRSMGDGRPERRLWLCYV
jgi:hypothetical protein